MPAKLHRDLQKLAADILNKTCKYRNPTLKIIKLQVKFVQD